MKKKKDKIKNNINRYMLSSAIFKSECTTSTHHKPSQANSTNTSQLAYPKRIWYIVKRQHGTQPRPLSFGAPEETPSASRTIPPAPLPRILFTNTTDPLLRGCSNKKQHTAMLTNNLVPTTTTETHSWRKSIIPHYIKTFLTNNRVLTTANTNSWCM